MARATTLTKPNIGGLTPKQRSFVDRYVGLVGETRWNASKSALEAGYAKPSVRVQAHQLLRHEGVQAAIRIHLEAERARFDLVRHEVLEELRAVALTRLTDVVSIDGDRVELRADRAPETDAALLEVTEEVLEVTETSDEEEGRTVRTERIRRKYKLNNKTQAAALLLRHIDGAPPQSLVQVGVQINSDGKDGLLRDQVEAVREILGILPPRTSVKRKT
jgi:phage terminase small subunit